MSHDVIIAGAGPTGLMLACELGLAGVRTVVTDPRRDTGTVSAGMGIHGRSLELLTQRGLDDRIGDEIFVWPRTPFAFLWLDLESADKADLTFAYPQWRTERLLEERARELGVDIRRGHQVTGFTQDANGVSVDVRGGDGLYRITAAYLVGCDGARSIVRECASIGFPASGPSYYGVTGDVRLAGGADGGLDVGLHPAGLFGALPLQPDMPRLMTIEFGREPPGPEVQVTVDELTASVARVTGKEPGIAEATWLHRYGGANRLADRYRDGRVFLAGDAAHTVFISGTQALNTGLQDAVNLGWKLAAAVHGWAPPGLLDSYHDERYPVGERMRDHARAQMALMHPLDAVGALRDLFGQILSFQEANRYLVQMPTLIAYPPADADTHPLVGARVPDVDLATPDGVVPLLRTLRDGRGVLVHLTTDSATVLDIGGWKDRVDVVTARPLPELGAATVLVRPDGHVAYADAAGTDERGLRSALATWFGTPA